MANQPGGAEARKITHCLLKMELLINCSPDNGKMNMKITGGYSTSTTSYSIYSDIQLEMKGMTMSMKSITKAKRVGGLLGHPKLLLTGSPNFSHCPILA